MHGPPLLVMHLLVGDNHIVSGRIFERHGHEKHRVKPQPDLLAHLRDKVCREPLLPIFMVQSSRSKVQSLARMTLDLGPWTLDFGLWTLDKVEIAKGRERHDARVKPGVTNFGYARYYLTTLGALDFHFVHPGPVQLRQTVYNLWVDS